MKVVTGMTRVVQIKGRRAKESSTSRIPLNFGNTLS